MNTTPVEQKHAESHALNVFERWHQSVVERNLDALMDLYAEDALLETPLVFVASGERADGTLRGRAAIRSFFRESFDQPKSGLGRWYRTGRFHAKDGQLIWEYPRDTPHGDQVDLAEVIDLDVFGRIACHRVYWGWKGFEALLAALRAKSVSARTG